MVLAFGLPVLYILSSGPLIWLADRNYLPHEVCTTILYPLIVLSQRSPLFSDLMERYIDLWS